jgi:hypothetical protein
MIDYTIETKLLSLHHDLLNECRSYTKMQMWPANDFFLVYDIRIQILVGLKIIDFLEY